ncbi:MAG: hypothetical protein ACYCQJ_05530 [Nitrososphaerales archaeon]
MSGKIISTVAMPQTKKTRYGNLKIEDVLNEELRREMGVEPESSTGKLKLQQRLSSIDDWEDIMHSVYELPIEIEGYTKKVGEMESLKEMIDILSSQKFENVKRSESRKKQLKKFVETMNMYYNLILTKKNGERVGYGALIYFPNLKKDNPERSGGIVLAERKVIGTERSETRFERAKFEDFLVEVKPYIEVLGNLYRKSRKP